MLTESSCSRADVVDRTPEMAGVDPAGRPRPTHALRSECGAPRLRRAQLDLGAGAHSHHSGVEFD
jgi:hypothetical protein